MKREFNQCTWKRLRRGLGGNLSFFPFFPKKREVTVNDRLYAAIRKNARSGISPAVLIWFTNKRPTFVTALDIKRYQNNIAWQTRPRPTREFYSFNVRKLSKPGSYNSSRCAYLSFFLPNSEFSLYSPLCFTCSWNKRHSLINAAPLTWKMK